MKTTSKPACSSLHAYACDEEPMDEVGERLTALEHLERWHGVSGCVDSQAVAGLVTGLGRFFMALMLSALMLALTAALLLCGLAAALVALDKAGYAQAGYVASAVGCWGASLLVWKVRGNLVRRRWAVPLGTPRRESS